MVFVNENENHEEEFMTRDSVFVREKNLVFYFILELEIKPGSRRSAVSAD